MKNFQLIVLFLLNCFGNAVFAQKKPVKKPVHDPQNIVISTFEHCKEKWEYIFITDSIRGRVIYRASAPFPCGNIKTGSITVIKTDKGDSLRIISTCDTELLELEDQLICIPERTVSGNAMLSYNNSAIDCKVKRTIYGRLIKQK